MSDEIEEDRPFKWAVIDVDNIDMWLDGRRVISQNKVLSLDKAQHADLQKLIRSGRPDITRVLQFIDIQAAEKIAKAHMASHRGAATQGAHNTNMSPAAQGKDAVSLNPVLKIPTPEGVGMTALERIKARTGNGNAAMLDASQMPTTMSAEEKAKIVLANAEEGQAIHPEDNDAAAKALAAANKQS